jgi:hypothetical protein
VTATSAAANGRTRAARKSPGDGPAEKPPAARRETRAQREARLASEAAAATAAHIFQVSANAGAALREPLGVPDDATVRIVVTILEVEFADGSRGVTSTAANVAHGRGADSYSVRSLLREVLHLSTK